MVTGTATLSATGATGDAARTVTVTLASNAAFTLTSYSCVVTPQAPVHGQIWVANQLTTSFTINDTATDTVSVAYICTGS